LLIQGTLLEIWLGQHISRKCTRAMKSIQSIENFLSGGCLTGEFKLKSDLPPQGNYIGIDWAGPECCLREKTVHTNNRKLGRIAYLIGGVWQTRLTVWKE
jgi:hypothetical protein